MLTITKIQPVLLSLLFMGGAVAVLVWMSISVSAFGERVYERMQTIANEAVFETQHKELLAAVESTETGRQILEQFILRDDNDTITLLSRIDEVALAQNVELTTINLIEVEKPGRFNDLSVGFQLSGDETAVTNMIQIFETLPYHGYITALSVGRTLNEVTGRLDSSASISLMLTKYD